jgi:cytidyltransferase-like protein
MNTFLTKAEKDVLFKWKYSVNDKSLTTKLLTPLYDNLVEWIPHTVSANVISLAGLIFILLGWSLALAYGGTNQLVSIAVAFCIGVYMLLDALDGKHARNTMTSSALGELFDHFCDCIGNVFLTHIFVLMWNINSHLTIWLLICVSQYSFFICHLNAYITGCIEFGKYDGPGEAIFALMTLVLLSPYCQNSLNNKYFNTFVLIFYIALSFSLFVKSIYLHYNTKNTNIMTKRYATSFGIFVCVICQIIKLIIQQYNNSECAGIFNGMLLGTLIGDIILSKITKRQLHPLIPIFFMISLIIPYTDPFFALLYFVTNVIDIANHLKIPILNPVVRMFVSGYFDGCHIGHKMLFLNASKHGTSLIVGVHSDDDSLTYKGKKPMNDINQRCYAVSQCEDVTEVIPSCEIIINEELIKKYKIHLVGMSEEYANNDPLNYYKYALDKGILCILPRTPGVSSTQLRDTNMQTTEQLSKLVETLHRIEEKISN